MAAYISLDQIICLLDSGCGQSLIVAFNEQRENLLASFNTMNLSTGNLLAGADNFTSPWLYVDDQIEMFLIFLLGALIFKNSKPAKTIGSMILITIVLSMIIAPIATHGVIERFKEAAENNLTADQLWNEFPFLTWTVKHAALVDTISDTLVNIGLSIAIYFRLKKISH